MLQRLAEQASTGGGAQALLAAAAAGADAEDELPTGIVDAVSHLIRVPEGLETAIEAALAERLAAVVVEDEQDAVAAIEYLRKQKAGTAALLPLEGMEHNYPLNLFNERGVIGVAARLVRTEQRYRPLIDTLLGRTIVVDDLDTARRMIRRGLGSVVTRDGVLLRPDGGYYGGHAGAAAQRFSLQTEIESLPAQIEEAQRSAAAARSRTEQAETAVTGAREAVERARDGVDQAEQLRRSHQQQIAALRGEQASLSTEMRLLRQSLTAGGDAATADAGGEHRDRGQRELETGEQEIAALRDRSQAVVAERDTVAGRVTAAAADLAAAEGAHRSEVEQREARDEARRRERERREQLLTQSQQLRRESEDLELSLRELRETAATTAAR